MSAGGSSRVLRRMQQQMETQIPITISEIKHEPEAIKVSGIFSVGESERDGGRLRKVMNRRRWDSLTAGREGDVHRCDAEFVDDSAAVDAEVAQMVLVDAQR